MKVLVLGATGYVGTRLVPELLAAGHDVRAGARNTEALEMFWWHAQVTAVEADVLDTEQLTRAMQGVDAVVYLVHGMGGEDFEAVDREAALRVRTIVAEAGVPRIVYLSGIVPDVPRDQLSAHIRSRLEVEEILLGSGAVTTVLRAAMVVGASSTSYEVLAQLSRRLPVTLMPGWMDSRVEPIAITDVVAALVRALDATDSRHLDIGGGEQLKYSDLLERFALLDGLDRTQITLPFMPRALVAEVAARIVDVPTSTVRSLIESLQHDMVADQTESLAALPGDRVSLDDALRRALDTPVTSDPQAMDPLGPLPGDPAWAEREAPGRR